MIVSAIMGYRLTGAGVGVRVLPDSPKSRTGMSSYSLDRLWHDFPITVEGLEPKGDDRLFRVFFSGNLICFALYAHTIYPSDDRGKSFVGIGIATDSQSLDLASIISFLIQKLSLLQIKVERSGEMTVAIDNLDETEFMPAINESLQSGDQTWLKRSLQYGTKAYLEVPPAYFDAKQLGKVVGKLVASRNWLDDNDIYFGNSKRLTKGAAAVPLSVLPFEEVLNPKTPDPGPPSVKALQSWDLPLVVGEEFSSQEPFHPNTSSDYPEHGHDRARIRYMNRLVEQFERLNQKIELEFPSTRPKRLLSQNDILIFIRFGMLIVLVLLVLIMSDIAKELPLLVKKQDFSDLSNQRSSDAQRIARQTRQCIEKMGNLEDKKLNEVTKKFNDLTICMNKLSQYQN